MDQKKIQEIQFLEQNMQAIFMQKQAFSLELSEINSSLKEIEKSKKDIYKVIGQVMIEVPKEKITEELKSREKLIELRIQSIEKQEKIISDKLKSIKNNIVETSKSQ